MTQTDTNEMRRNFWFMIDIIFMVIVHLSTGCILILPEMRNDLNYFDTSNIS